MKKYILSTLAVCVLLSSCEEFTPVFTFKYDDPQHYENVSGSPIVKPGDMEPNMTIKELSALYTPGTTKPFVIGDDIIIAGRVISSDRRGNFYNQIYIQDETGGIEVKIGKNSLYNDYKLGQKVYVICGPTDHTLGLTIGSYGFKSGNYGGNGMTQLGSQFFSGTYGTEYETTYIRSDRVINEHIFREDPADAVPVQPEVITESQLPGKNATLSTCPYLGKLVTLKGLKYDNQAFALLYLNSDESNKNSKNRVFLSDQTWGIDSWALSKSNFLTRLQRGDWDEAKIGNANDQNYGSVGNVDVSYLQETDAPYYENIKTNGDAAFSRTAYYYIYGKYPQSESDINPDDLIAKWPRYCLARNANGYSVSQYFKMGDTQIQLRTSGFSKFSDEIIPAEVLSGAKTVSMTGILTLYQGSVQFIVNDSSDIVVE